MPPPLLTRIIQRHKGTPPFTYTRIGSKHRGPCDECVTIIHVRKAMRDRPARAYTMASWEQEKHPLCTVHAELWRKYTSVK